MVVDCCVGVIGTVGGSSNKVLQSGLLGNGDVSSVEGSGVGVLQRIVDRESRQPARRGQLQRIFLSYVAGIEVFGQRMVNIGLLEIDTNLLTIGIEFFVLTVQVVVF